MLLCQLDGSYGIIPWLVAIWQPTWTDFSLHMPNSIGMLKICWRLSECGRTCLDELTVDIGCLLEVHSPYMHTMFHPSSKKRFRLGSHLVEMQRNNENCRSNLNCPCMLEEITSQYLRHFREEYWIIYKLLQKNPSSECELCWLHHELKRTSVKVANYFHH
jgi:hypothetical protein